MTWNLLSIRLIISSILTATPTANAQNLIDKIQIESNKNGIFLQKSPHNDCPVYAKCLNDENKFDDYFRNKHFDVKPPVCGMNELCVPDLDLQFEGSNEPPEPAPADPKPKTTPPKETSKQCIERCHTQRVNNCDGNKSATSCWISETVCQNSCPP